MRTLIPVLLIALAAAGCGGGSKGTTNTAARADTNVSPSQVIQLAPTRAR